MDTKIKEWKQIPKSPKYEMNESGEVRIIASKVKKVAAIKDGVKIVLLNSPSGYFEMIELNVFETLAALFPSGLYNKSVKASDSVPAPEVGQAGKDTHIYSNSPKAKVDDTYIIERIPAPSVPASDIGREAKEQSTPKPKAGKITPNPETQEAKSFDHVKGAKPKAPKPQDRKGTGADNTNFKGYYIIQGVRYPSARLAAEALGVSHVTIANKCKAGKDGYSFEPAKS